MRIDQLGLLLWKNYVVRKRQLGMLSLVFLWPVMVFLILFTVRDNVDPEYHPTCQFPARLMPQDGFLPFLQSFVCSTGSPCESLSEYEEVPSFKNVTLSPLLRDLQPILENDTILEAVRTLPNSIRLLKSMAQILTRPEIKKLFDKGIRLGDLFLNHTAIKSFLRMRIPDVNGTITDSLFNASIRLYYLIETFSSSNIDGTVCSPESLKKYLILPVDEDIVQVSDILCNINPKQIPDILKHLTEHLDFTGLLEMVNRVMAKFRDYDLFEDLKRTSETILSLKMVNKYVPHYLKLQKWVPKIIPLFKNVTFKEIDLSFINRSIDVLNPIFEDERDWSIARDGFQKLNMLLSMVKNILSNGTVDSSNNLFNLTKRVGERLNSLPLKLSSHEDVTQLLDTAYVILKDGAKLTGILLDQHEDEIQIGAQILDALRDLFPKNILNVGTYCVSLLDNVVRTTYHVAMLHSEMSWKIYNVSRKHEELVQRILRNVNPAVYQTIVLSFARLDFVERFVAQDGMKNPEEFLCLENTFNEILNNSVISKDKYDEIRSLICSDEGKIFISEVYDSFELGNFKQIVENTLSTFINMAFQQPVKIEKSNLTSAFRSVKRLMSYLETSSLSEPNWHKFVLTKEWIEVFNSTRAQGRLDILGIHLSIAKMLGSRSLSFITIKPDLEIMDMLSNLIVRDFHTNPTEWINEVQSHMSQLIESFYLTVTDRKKALKILEYSNFTETYCTKPDPPQLLNYPVGSNKTLLKELVCRLSKFVLIKLEMNVTAIMQEERTYLNDETFNWTSFNEKTIEIYKHIDTLVNQEDPTYNSSKLQKLKSDFAESWTKNLTVRDAWEISVGLLCKLFDLMESPLFNVQAKPEWNNLYALAWASDVLLGSMEIVIDRIQSQNLSLKISELLYDMPQTDILMEVVLRNLAPITLDIVDMMTLKIPVHFISTIAEYRTRESSWPCIHKESIGDALELRNGSRQIIREIERISCNPGLFIREWNDQPVLSRLENIFKDDRSMPAPSFNWTSGYAKFRQMVAKFSVLLENSELIILTDTPSLSIYTERFLPELKTIFIGRLPTVKQETSDLLVYIDHEIDKNIFKSNLTAYEVWRSTEKIDKTDYIFVVGKFIAHVLYKMTSLALDVLHDVSGSKIGLLPILGFKDKSAVSIVYNEFPNILATVINGISDPVIESQILKFFENGSTTMTCSQLFSWFAYSRIGISSDDYRILKNFTCDLDPENFNAFTDLFMGETVIWRKPVSNYRLYFVSLVGKFYELGTTINETLSSGLKIELPFSEKYFDNALKSLKGVLETNHGGRIIQNLMTDPSSRTYQIVIEGISEILSHITKSLQKVQIKENELHTWELAEIGNVRQLLRLLETHPMETISLMASINWIDPATGQFPSFKIFRKTMCNLHFNSVYWSNPNRTHFLNEVCSFDSHQLLKSATSNEFFDVIIDSTTKLQRIEPLSVSLTKLLDVVSNFTVANPKVVFRSNIFNATTWKNLDNETSFLLRKAEESWVHQLVIKYKYVDANLNDDDRSIENRTRNKVVCMLHEARSFVDASILIQLFSSSMDLFAGGDVWQKLRNIYESSKLKPLLTMIEDIPNLAVTAVDTFVNSEKLNDFLEQMFAGRVNLCDVGRYLITPTFMRKKGLLSSISNFCQRIVLNDEIFEQIEFLPVYTKYKKDPFECKIPLKYISINYGVYSFNETYLFEALQRFQSISIRLLSEGIKSPRIPSWWMSFEEGTLKDFVTQYKNKDLKVLAHSIVKKTTTLLNKVLNSSTTAKNCTWCNTAVIDILNSQLSHHALYSELVCKMNRLNFSEIQDILIHDFHWNETIHMIKGYRFLRQKKTVNDFMAALENTLHHVVDIFINFQDVSNRRKIYDCFYKFVGGSSFGRPGLYVSLLNGIVDFLRENVYILDTATTHEKIGKFGKLAERNVSIWKPLREVVKTSYLDVIDRLFPNASINVNMFNTSIGRNASALYNILTSKKSGKLLQYDPKAANLSSILEVSEKLSQSLDHDLIDREITSWRREAFWNLTWLKEILKHITAVLGESGSLLDVASKIDFQDVSNLLGVPDFADGVVNLLKEKTIDKLFSGLNELLDDVDPFIEDPVVRKDLRTIVETFESMEIFKNLGLLNMKYAVKDMFVNWDVLRAYLIEKVHIPKDIVLAMSQGRVDMLSVFMNERQTIGLKHTICSPKKLGDMLVFDRDQIMAEEISSTLCQLDDEQIQNLTIILIKNLNFEYIFKNLMSANVKNILSNANLTEVEGKAVLTNLGVAKELLPFFKEKLSAGFLSSLEVSKNNSNEMATNERTQFLTSAGEMMCGRPLIAENRGLYKVISNIEDNERDFDEKELESLPTDFCRETYKSIQKMNGGKIVWSYVKPLLRGYILYAPNSTVIQKVMQLANGSFVQMEKFGDLMNGFEKSLISLVSLSEMGDSLKELRNIMSSDVMKIAAKSLSDKSLDGDFLKLNLSEVAWQLKRSTKLVKTVRMLNDLMECVLVDRIKGLATEEELEREAGVLTKTNEFLAGVVFLEENGSVRSKRSFDVELPTNVTYKIRMDVDYVPTTNRLKNQFWLPGPESNFIEDLRYLRGFIQLQDSIDRAIIKLKSRKEQNWKTVTQQMPYPCWKYAPFQSVLYESQGMQVCFFFALMMCAGSAVWYIVWEKESQNSMVMSVMGLKPWRNTLAWFITSFIEMSIVMISIWIILIAGKILPRSDPTLVLLLFLDYVFAIVTFCYMISMMFNSASLAAVTTVVMFLLTYMPYIIVIAMEASMNLGYKLLICLSMSTSFSYGCLFAVRKEVQGTGLTWNAMWEESSPGDAMSLGLVLLMIALDGCLYALIGYLLARYMNSGRGFHGLRSRSLWWANTRALYNRPSYLAFVNNLYFTNDVTHQSASHQEFDNDADRLTFHEKQIGVRFEAVRKVFRTDQGECVAVNDFTLKLREGEVTALLGRNGAGKTTIIKMLTGMLAPTSGEIFLNSEEGCKPEIGVCPQDNVLIGTLTPREHMVFYARLKKRTDNLETIRNVNAMLDSMELGRQEHELVSRLSGGTKRRLCVALAFLASPKLVILDEPGAGVDPAARRRIWRLIDRHRIGRTVLLSTHHLDEADMLSDVVVVMHKGRILCSGSPLTLKMTYGLGYTLNVSFSSSQEARGTINEKSLDSLRTTMESVVPNVLLNDVSGSEVVLTLPFQGIHGTTNDIGKAAKVLEDNQKLLGFSHFSLECDTLERVFLDLCMRADNASSCARPTSTESISSIRTIGLTIPTDDVDLISTERSSSPSAVKQIRALLKKRIWHFARDWRAPLAALILPTMFVAIAMGFSLIRPPSGDEPALPLSPNLYDVHPTYFYSIDNGSDQFLRHVSLQLHDRFGDDYAGAWQVSPNDTGTCECQEGQQVCLGGSQAVEGLFQTLPGRPTLDWIVSTHQEYIEKRYGGWSLSHSNEDPLFVVWYNNKGHHSLPAYLSALNEAILRASGVYGHITTFNHPLKLSSDQLNRTTLLQHVADVGIALVLLIAFSLVGAQGAKELVRERLSEEKRILYLAGVHPVTYWITAMIWDFLIFACSICLAIIVFEIFGLSTYVARDNLPATCLLLFLFAWAVIPFTHLAEKAFDDASVSNMVLFCLNTFIGVASLATILVIDILGKGKTAEDIRNILHNVLLLLPQYTLGDALVQMAKNDITAELLERFHMNTYKSPLGWELIGLHYLLLLFVGAVLYAANLMIECRVLPDLVRRKVSYEDTAEEDEDVAEERTRVERDLVDDDILKIINLRKEFRSVYGTNVAVQNLSFGVRAGQCFGLLGVNGAGKSTTFKMLTTEMRSTAGRIVLGGKEIGRQPLCTGEVGYCPQGNAVDPFLSPYQCLTIHAEVCGLGNVSVAVESMLKKFDLVKYAHQRVSSLSGGNKRKLCAAISVMAPASVVLMDEPTSGMDPASKDLVARVIRAIIKNQGCVLMTSHSVAESENLCTRVGVIARAGLRCIGSPQYLKHKFGEGYVVFLRFSSPMDPTDLKRAISRHLPHTIISSRQALAARLLLPRKQDLALSTIFIKVGELAEELKATDYTLTQSSLDQVLVNFSDELEDESGDSLRFNQENRTSYPNMYSSMDTIHMDTF